MRQERNSVAFSRNPSAFTFTDLLIVVGMVALLAALLLPALSAAKAKGQVIRCENKLKQFYLAFATWALDHNERYPMHVSVTNGGTMELANSGLVFPHFQVMSNELSSPMFLTCPYDRKRRSATNWAGDFDNTNLSYFIGLDAIERSPSSILAGDRNLTNELTPGNRLVILTTNSSIAWTKAMHSQEGNILFADGSVHQVGNSIAGDYVQMLGAGTNRLAVP